MRDKFETDDPRCDKCGSSLDYCEEEGVKTWWQCPNCGNVENVHDW